MQLKFSVVDPAPERGTTGAAFWRIAIGTESGSTWWTTDRQHALVGHMLMDNEEDMYLYAQLLCAVGRVLQLESEH